MSKFFIKIDSSNSFDMAFTYNENFRAILWYTGIVAIASYCNWCETWNSAKVCGRSWDDWANGGCVHGLLHV